MTKKPDELGSYLAEMQRRADAFEPKLISSDPAWQRREALKDIMPQGSSLTGYQPSRSATLFGGGLPEGSSTMPGGGGSSQYHMRRPYQPEIDSVDRQDFPQDRKRANAYWRMFHKYDPCFGTAMDMYAEMLTSTFDIIIQEDTSSEIRDTLEYMCDEVSFIEKLRYIVREFLVLGEVFPHCHPPDQEVFTLNGFKHINEITIGDLVLTHKGRFCPVKEIYPRDYDGNLLNFKISYLSAFPFKCTTEHPLYVLSDTGPCWKRANTIKAGDYVSIGVDRTVKDIEDIDITDVVPEYFELLQENEKHYKDTKRSIDDLKGKDIIKIDSDFLRLLGYYYAEGCSWLSTRKGRVIFSFHEDETKYHEDVLFLVKKIFGIDGYLQHASVGKGINVYIDSKLVAHFFLNLFGTGCRDKKIPDWLRYLPPEKQKHILIGLFRGDGNLYCAKDKTETTIAQMQLAHRGLVHLAWQILLRMGVYGAACNSFNRKMYGKYWKCVFNANEYSDFAEEIFEVNVSHHPNSRKLFRVVDDLVFYRVSQIATEEYKGLVYNLEVADDHSYTVGGVVGHNCFYDDELKIWTHIGFHNPDYMEVKDLPMISMDPILNVLPDASMKAALSENTPESRELRQKLPGEFVSKVLAGQKIRLSPTNCSMLARKLHPYDVRGTSLATRLWRIWMVEDAVYNATIAIYRRHAGPVKCLKLGDPTTGYLPDPSQETRMLEMLARAELDPNCFVPETPITMSDNTRKLMCDLSVGDYIKNKEGNIEKVDVLKEETTDEIMEIRAVGEPLIKCTSSHMWPIWGTPRVCSCGCGQRIQRGNFAPGHRITNSAHTYQDQKLSWPKKKSGVKIRFLEGFDPYQKVKAEDIHPGDYFIIPRKFEEIIPNDVSPEQARLLGYYAAEGYILTNSVSSHPPHKRHGFSLCFSLEERDTLVKDCVNIIEKLCGYTPVLRCRENITSCEVMAASERCDNLASWLEKHAGSYSKTKKLSSEVMCWPLSLKLEFLKGYCSGDGSYEVDKKGVHSLHIISASRSLLSQVKDIIIQFGYYTSFQERVNTKGFSKGKPHYRLDIMGKAAKFFVKSFWDIDISDVNCKYGQRWWADDNYVYVRVMSVKKKKLDAPIKVINMTVSGDHSYMAHGFGTYNSWLVTNYAVNFEAWGTTQQAISIARDHDVIERIKLVALGLSKSFLGGEITYSSAKSGLQVFLRRLLSMRQFLESTWIYPKFFKPICQMNGWKKAKPSEVTHRYRMKRTSQEIQEENLLIVPKLVWHNKLDPNLDDDLLRALGQIKQQFGIKVRKETICNAAGINWEEELSGHYKEFLTEEKIKTKILGETKSQEYDAQESAGGAKPPGTPGAGALPPGAKPPKGGGPTPPGGAAKNVTLNDAVEPPGGAGGGSEMPTTIE